MSNRLADRGKMEISHRPISELLPYARNARTHSDAQVAQIAASMMHWGWTNPVLIDERGMIIAGHGRVLAARKLKLTDDIPCIVLDGLSDIQKQALVLADNKLTMNSGWDDEMLVMELGELSEAGFDMDTIGFSAGEIEALLHGSGPGGDAEGDDEIKTPPVIPVTVEGDLWILGRHRLLCGDSTMIDHVDRLMNNKQADVCFTSPPYGQQRQYEVGGISDWDALMQGVFGILPVKPDAQLLVNLGLVHRDCEWVSYWDGWIEFMREAGWRKFGWYVWDQGAGLPGDFRGRLAPSFEFIFHLNREIVKPHRTVPKKAENIKDKSYLGVKRPKDGTFDTNNYSPKSSLNTHKILDSVIRVQRHTGGLGEAGAHPAVFPVDLVSEMLCAFSNPDDIVYEPFCGSGTQIISAQKNGRSCMAMEISPAYVDVAIHRYQKFSGQTAKLESTGQTFDEVSDARPRTKG